MPARKHFYPLHWTAENIIAAFHAWADKHGAPPKSRDWRRGAPEHPARPTVEKMFGSWNKGMVAAGFTPRAAHGPGRWRSWDKDAIAASFLDFLLTEGRWPTSTDCGAYRGNGSHKHPNLPDWRTVFAHFGSFVAAKRAAGWDGTDPRAKRKPHVEFEPPRCVGCGGEIPCRTIGCKACNDRARKRVRRKADPAFRAYEAARRRHAHIEQREAA
jgi:hypothetical protein